MRCVAFVVVSMLLGGCTTRDPYVTSAGDTTSGNWRIAHQVDRITGVELPSASVSALASSSYVQNPRPALLQLTCFEKQPLVRISFEFKIGADKDSALGYRFDDKPGRDSVESRVLIGHDAIVIDDKAAMAQFINDLARSRMLFIRVRSLTAGRTTAEFKLDGSAPAMQAAFAGCPISTEQPKKRTS